MVFQGYLHDVSIVVRGITGTIDDTDNEHTDVIRQFSPVSRTGWMDGWENRQKGMALPTMLVVNEDVKLLADECKETYTLHLYKFDGPTDEGCGVDATKQKLRRNQILKW